MAFNVSDEDAAKKAAAFGAAEWMSYNITTACTRPRLALLSSARLECIFSCVRGG